MYVREVRYIMVEQCETNKFYVIKKDGTKESFEIQKVVNAVKKSAHRVLINFTDEQIEKICSIVSIGKCKCKSMPKL